MKNKKLKLLALLIPALMLGGFMAGCSDDSRHEDEQGAEDAASNAASGARAGTPVAGGTANGRADYAGATKLFEYVDVLATDADSLLSLVFNRFRMYKSNPANYSPTTKLDEFLIELWFTKPSNTNLRYYEDISNSVSGKIVNDADGNLYDSDFPIGAVINQYGVAYPGNNEGTSFAVTAANAFTNKNFDVSVTWPVNSSAAEASTGYPWTDHKILEGINLATDIEFTRNTDLATTTTIGCEVDVGDGSGGTTSTTYVWQAIEMGHYTSMPDFDLDGDGVDDDETDDDIGNDTVIAYNHEWDIHGINAAAHTINLVRKSTGQAYYRRALPSGTASGMEKLVQACNAAAADTGGTFRIFYMDANDAIQLVSNDARYCQDYADEVAATVDLTTYPAACLSNDGTTSWNSLLTGGSGSYFNFYPIGVTRTPILTVNFEDAPEDTTGEEAAE
jgi:hypothetical protein